MVSFALALLLSTPTLAQDCDVRSLSRQLKDAPPIRIADHFLALAECDDGAARRVAKATVPRILPGDRAAAALVEAAHLGAETAVREWLDRSEPDVRSRTIDAIGRRCEADPDKVSAFLVSSADALGDAFWEQRWYRGLGSCPTEPVRALLTQGLDHPKVGRDVRPRTPFYGVLEVYARNLGAQALPTLTELVSAPHDDRDAVTLVNAFADAGGAAEREPDPSRREAAAQALIQAVPGMPREAVERARGVLNALQAPDQASSIARHAWPQAWNDAYTWAVALTEVVTCRNGKVDVYLYTGLARDEQGRWPDEILPRLEDAARAAWPVDGAARCRGTSTFELATPGVPVTQEAAQTFLQERRAGLDDVAPQARRTRVVEPPAFTLD